MAEGHGEHLTVEVTTRRTLVVVALTLAMVAVGLPGRALTGVSWPESQALPRFAAPHHLDVADVATLPGDDSFSSTPSRESSTGLCRASTSCGGRTRGRRPGSTP